MHTYFSYVDDANVCSDHTNLDSMSLPQNNPLVTSPTTQSQLHPSPSNYIPQMSTPTRASNHGAKVIPDNVDISNIRDVVGRPPSPLVSPIHDSPIFWGNSCGRRKRKATPATNTDYSWLPTDSDWEDVCRPTKLINVPTPPVVANIIPLECNIDGGVDDEDTDILPAPLRPGYVAPPVHTSNVSSAYARGIGTGM